MTPKKVRMVVDPTKCDAKGLCIELFPEAIRSDPWGYPIIRPEPIPHQWLDHAYRAVESCPKLALILVTSDD